MATEIVSPKPYQVLQRGKNTRITIRTEHEPANCTLTVKNYRSGETVTNLNLKFQKSGDGLYTADFLPVEGGWYNFTLTSDENIHLGEVAPVGVGEVFVIAGQSHATNSNNKQFAVTEPEGRVTVYDPAVYGWRIAHDPQPCYDRSDYNARFGSIWPCTFDRLNRQIRLPVGMTNAAFGATALFQWQSGGENFEHLVTCCRAADGFRAILWQQGESDVMWHTETDAYVSGMLALKSALDAELGIPTKWLIAKSTIHPSVYDDREHEEKIRNAYEILFTHEGFYPGPDTDTLNGSMRDRGSVSGHLTEAGQLAAGELWSEAILNFIKSYKNITL